MKRLFCLLLLWSMSWFGSAAWADPRVLVFGDSLSAAYNLPKEEGWVADLQRRLNASPVAATLVNASVSGETTAGGRNRLATALQQHKPALLVLQLGANDGLRGLPLKHARNNLEAMISMAKKAGVLVLLVGIKLPPNYGKNYGDEMVQMYQDIAKTQNVKLVPFLLEGIADKPEMFLPDGLHPNAVGQSRAGDNIWPVLLQMLMEKSK